MSDRGDEEKTRDALGGLETWAQDEISHLKQRFEARSKLLPVPGRARGWIGFFIGLCCGLMISAILLLWFYPQIFSF